MIKPIIIGGGLLLIVDGEIGLKVRQLNFLEVAMKLQDLLVVIGVKPPLVLHFDELLLQGQVVHVKHVHLPCIVGTKSWPFLSACLCSSCDLGHRSK